MSENKAIIPVDRTLLAKGSREWADLAKEVAELPCETPEQQQWWADRLNQAQQTLKASEAARLALTKPLKTEAAEIDGAFREHDKVIESAKELFAGKISGYLMAQNNAKAALRLQAGAAAQAGDVCTVEETMAALAVVAPAVQGVAVTWSWEVAEINTAILSDNFKVPNLPMLKDLCKGFKDREDAPVVPGVTFVRKAGVSPRGSK